MLSLPVLAEGKWERVCQSHVMAAGLLCWRMLLLSSLKISIDWTAGNFNLDVFSRFMINVMCCERWTELEWKLFIVKLLIFSLQCWNSLLLLHLGQSICCNPQCACNGVCCIHQYSTVSSAACSLALPLPTCCLLGSFLCTVLHYFTFMGTEILPLSVYMNSCFDVCGFSQIQTLCW